MREIRPSSLEGGVRLIPHPYPYLSHSYTSSETVSCARLASDLNSRKVSIPSKGKDKVVLRVEGILRDPGKRGPEVDYTLVHAFFNDGVAVTAVKLIPRAVLRVEQAVLYRLPAQGWFSHYLHKNRDERGDAAARGILPAAGEVLRLTTLTSCLQVLSPAAALAIFTDGGALHLSRPKLDTAVAEVTAKDESRTDDSLTQHLVHIAAGDNPYLLKAGEPFTFRVGISVAPCRLPHPRLHDLRMFTWIGDARHPYPTDEEISGVARFGFTLFQMHRVGAPGEPRPLAGEFERVLRKVHESGMLFLWEENADLLYASAPGVREMKAKGEWSLWQGFNLEDYWSYYGFAKSLPAPGMIWPGDDEPTRCPTSLVYNYDLLTGGGQYTHLAAQTGASNRSVLQVSQRRFAWIEPRDWPTVR